MKLLKIINKNLKLLMRSRLSAMVMVIGPLLIILLVGLSFNKSTNYFLDIGVYASEYNEFTDSFIDRLDSDTYSITRYDELDTCINDIKLNEIHSCIVFPDDFRISNDKTNEIVFYVDQTRINLVYLIVNTFKTTIQNRSSEISYNLTSGVLDTVFQTQEDIGELKKIAAKIDGAAGEISQNQDNAVTKLTSIDLSVDSELTSFGDEIGSLSSSIKSNLNSIESDVEDLRDETEDLKDNGNMSSQFDDDFDDLISIIVEINDTVLDMHNDTDEDIEKLIDKFDGSIDDMVKKLNSASSTNAEVAKKLENIKQKSASVELDVIDLNAKMDQMSANIDNIDITSAKSIVSPITTKIEPIVKDESNLGQMYPSLIILLIMFIGLMLPSLLIIMEKKSMAYFRTFATPTGDRHYILSHFLTSAIIIAVQLTLILGLSHYYFKIELLSNIYMIALVILSSMSLFILLGMFVGYLFNTEEMATIAAVSLASLFLLTSGLIFPLEIMPDYISEIAQYNPFIVGSELLKKSLLFDQQFPALRDGLQLMLLASAIILVLVVFIQKATKFRILHTKPSRKQMKKEYLVDLFRINDRPVSDLAGFLNSVKRMEDDVFKKALKERAFKDWLKIILNNKRMSKAVSKLKTKDEIVKCVEEELKKKK